MFILKEAKMFTMKDDKSTEIIYDLIKLPFHFIVYFCELIYKQQDLDANKLQVKKHLLFFVVSIIFCNFFIGFIELVLSDEIELKIYPIYNGFYGFIFLFSNMLPHSIFAGIYGSLILRIKGKFDKSNLLFFFIQSVKFFSIVNIFFSLIFLFAIEQIFFYQRDILQDQEVFKVAVNSKPYLGFLIKLFGAIVGIGYIRLLVLSYYKKMRTVFSRFYSLSAIIIMFFAIMISVKTTGHAYSYIGAFDLLDKKEICDQVIFNDNKHKDNFEQLLTFKEYQYKLNQCTKLDITKLDALIIIKGSLSF